MEETTDQRLPWRSPAGLMASDHFLLAALLSWKSLLLRDTDWEDLHEVGYVKQKVAGGKLASKLRTIIPNSTILRLLSSIAAYCEHR